MNSGFLGRLRTTCHRQADKRAAKWLFFFFFQITTQLQYIEDSEPTVDGSRNRWCAVQWATKANQRCNKTKPPKQQKATESNWKVAPHGRGATPYTDCRWSTRIQIGLSVNHTPEYLRGEALTTASGRMFQSRTVRGETNKDDSHMTMVGCGKPESFLLAWVQDATCWAVSMPKDNIRTRVAAFDTAKHFIIPIETLFV